MDNQKHNIEELFRQRLQGAEVPPPPFVWPAVEQELQRRRRRPLLLWLFAFGTVAAAGVWIWQSGQKASSNQAQNIVGNAEIHQNNLQQYTKQPLEEDFKGDPGYIIEKIQPIAKNQVAKRPNSVNESSRIDPILNQEVKVEESNRVLISNLVGSEPLKNTVVANDGNPLMANGLPLVVSMANKKELVSPAEFKPNARRKKVPPKLCYDFAQHPTAWLLDVYAGPSLAQRSLTSALDDEPYLNQRLATERRSVAMNAGIRASLMFNRNILVRTGLHYDQVTEVFEFIDPTHVITRINQIYVNGQFVRVDTVVSYGENYLKTYNRYAMLDVPLLVGVEMRQGRTGLSINAGVSANVLFHKRGVIIDPITHEPARFGAVPDDPDAVGPQTSLSREAFRANVGLSATASIQWYWHINPHWRLFAEPSFRQVLRPVTLNSHPVEQRYSIIGLRLGATKIF
ncbi:MAG: hypothetical protein ACKVT2_15200 [Saprospiraceae bacterium]